MKIRQSKEESLKVLRRGGVISVDYENGEDLVPPFPDLSMKSVGASQLPLGKVRVYWQLNTSLLSAVFNLVSLVVSGRFKENLLKAKGEV